nr:MAG TPA: hypothetical protein [Caudoviricetes sp.]
MICRDLQRYIAVCKAFVSHPMAHKHYPYHNKIPPDFRCLRF